MTNVKGETRAQRGDRLRAGRRSDTPREAQGSVRIGEDSYTIIHYVGVLVERGN
jgi:hypothetical protein